MLHVEEYMPIERDQYTQNELNNIIFLCLKYTFGKTYKYFKEPRNSDINLIMLVTYNDQTSDNIIDAILSFVIEKVSPNRLIGEIDGYKHYMRCIINKFNKQSYSLRNDLGNDVDDEDLITKH
jgi:hypothetical protein